MIVLYIILIFLLWKFIPGHYYVDWIIGLRSATWKILSLRSPYTISGIYNPPWTFIPLIPLALLPPRLGAVLLSLLSFFSIIFIARKLGANLLQMVFFLAIPQFAFKAITNPNIDFLAAFGFILPPQIGLFFLAMKPQIGVAVAVFWLVESWRSGGWKKVLRVFAPVSIAFLLSFVIFGPYFMGAGYLVSSEEVWWDYKLWPFGIPIGFALLTLAVRKKIMGLSITASPFFSPYVASYSWPYALLGLFAYPIEYFVVYVGYWVVYLYMRIFVL